MTTIATRTLLVSLLLSLLAMPALADDRDSKEKSSAATAQEGQTVRDAPVRDVLARFDKDWRPYTNEPNLGDPRWKLKMETLVRLARAGQDAFPLLEEAAKEGSPWSKSTRDFAKETLPILRKDELRKDLAEYDLAQMDSARIGKSAPDFALKDAAGKTHRLSEFRDKKIVVLTFVIQDT